MPRGPVLIVVNTAVSADIAQLILLIAVSADIAALVSRLLDCSIR